MNLVDGTTTWNLQVSPVGGSEKNRATWTFAIGERTWSFDEAQHLGPSVGVSGGQLYVWSAHGLFLLTDATESGPTRIAFEHHDELRFVFQTAGGWLLVGELSLVLISGGVEGSPFYCDEVILDAKWLSRDVIRILQWDDKFFDLRISDGHLALV